MNDEDLNTLIMNLLAAGGESEWIEFKENNAEPEEIGQYLSAISNSVALLQRDAGFMVWGIEGETHAIVGTAFRPRDQGGQRGA